MTNQITWRPATSDDVGRLARCKATEDSRWQYGMILNFFTWSNLEGIHEAYVVSPGGVEVAHGYNICEVQVVPPKIRGLEWNNRRLAGKTVFEDWTAYKFGQRYIISKFEDDPWTLGGDGFAALSQKTVDSADHGKQLAWELWKKRVMEEVLE